jgi:hypothetical protein
MESTLEKKAVGYQIAHEREMQSGITASNLSMISLDRVRMPVHFEVGQKKNTSNGLKGAFQSVWSSVSRFGSTRIDERRLTTRDPWLAVYSTRKDF